MLTLSDVLPNPEFLAQRQKLQASVLEAKSVRRFALGPNFTLLFENHETCLWQVQEMCRVEQIVAPAAVQHELDTYNALLPKQHELSATLLIEYEIPSERDQMLRQLLGLPGKLWLDLGAAGTATALFDGEQFNEERLSSVQFIRIPLTGPQFEALRALAEPATLVVQHPAYTATARLPLTLRAALIEDLSAV